MAYSLVQEMGTQHAWGLQENQRLKTPKVAQKVSLVTPRMDVDVTGVSFKNLRTHVIDHPRDDGLKQREQLWNFQQKYRGAAGKQRSISVSMSRSASAADCTEKIEADRKLLKSVKSDPTLSLHARFRRRYFNKLNMSPVRRQESSPDITKRNGTVERNGMDKKNSRIQRLYSSGMIVRNSLYNQIRGTEQEDKRIDSADNSSIIEAMEKFGSLEKLPDISYSQPPLTSRFMKTLNHYGRRYGDPTSRMMQLRRSLTNLSDGSLSSPQRRLLIVSRREVSFHMDCIDSDNDDNDDDDEDNDGDDEEDDDEDDDEDIDDECNIDDDALRSQRKESLLSIRNNVTLVNSEEDLELIDSHHSEKCQKEANNAKVVCNSNVVKPDVNNHHSNNLRSCGSTDQTSSALQVSSVVFERKTDPDKIKDSENNKAKRSLSKQCKKDKGDDKDERPSSTDSLDMPKEKFGPTTHSIDRKLAIRKPWEWRPSPYRWTDKSVKESDKPYIEKIINRGEIIDEYTYDAFARTKPLKLSHYPDPPYKDRTGILR